MRVVLTLFWLMLALLPDLSLGQEQVKRSMLTTNLSSTNVLYASRTLLVDAVYGNDATASRESSFAIFKTIGHAVTNAQAGDLVYVRPGNYTNNALLKGGVDLRGESATVYWTQPATGPGYGIFDDRASGATTNLITGNWKFVYNCSPDDVAFNANQLGAVVVTKKASAVTLKGHRFSGTDKSQTGSSIFYLTNGTVRLDFDEVIDPNLATSIMNGTYWKYGPLDVRIGSNSVSAVAIYNESVGFAAEAHDMYYKGDFVRSEQSQCLYQVTPGAGNPNYKSWVTITGQMESKSGNTCLLAGGKTYLKAYKIGRTAGVTDEGTISLSGDSTNWIWVQKISAAALSAITFQSSYSGRTTFMTPIEIEDTGAMANAIHVNGGEVIIHGGNAKVLAGKGVNIASGTLRLNNFEIDCTASGGGGAATNNRCVHITGGNLALGGSTVLYANSSHNESIFAATAQNFKIYGTVFSNKRTNALATYVVGTLVEDADVVP